MISKEKRKNNGIITTITISVLFPLLIIALIIYLSGFKGPVQFDQTYYNFMQQAAIEASSWGIKIPNIPLIPYGSNVDNGFDIIGVLVNFVNFFVNLFNVIIMIINLVISLFTTIAAIVKLIMSFGDYNFSTSGSLSYWVQNSVPIII